MVTYFAHVRILALHLITVNDGRTTEILQYPLVKYGGRERDNCSFPSP